MKVKTIAVFVMGVCVMAIGPRVEITRAANQLPAASQLTLYTSLWRPGTGVQYARAGMTSDQFKTQDQTYFDTGLRLADLKIDGGKFAAVWRPGTGAQHWHAGMTNDQFKTQDQTYFDTGLRLVDLEIDGGKFAGVWRPGTGAQHWHAGLSFDKFKAQDKLYFDTGLRLVDLEIEGGEFAGVWRPGAGAQYWQAGMSVDDLVAQNKAYAAQGLRLKVLKTVAGRLAAVWQPGTGAQDLRFGMSAEGFTAEDKKAFDKGLRLEALEVHVEPVVIYRMPFSDASGWTLNTGNWDDPGNGHTKGKPLGLQAYAYDINHAEGGQIRAARGGTVHTLVQSESGNSWGSKDLCKPGVGNYLVIAHGDGTFGVYWHLKQNGASVKVGGTVKAGDPIAQSGNTGYSSAPHLHFDVRIGWDLNYSCSNLAESPSLPVFFADKNHAYWRPVAGDALAPNNP